MAKGVTMSAVKISGLAVALAGMLAGPPVATAFDAQEYANIESQCRREAQDYGIVPEQIEDYVNSCVLAYGGMPAAEASPVEPGAEAPADEAQGTDDTGEPDTGAALE
jgi:hypothetical protein